MQNCKSGFRVFKQNSQNKVLLCAFASLTHITIDLLDTDCDTRAAVKASKFCHITPILCSLRQTNSEHVVQI